MEGRGGGHVRAEDLIWVIIVAAPLMWLVLFLPQALGDGGPTIPISQVASSVQKGSVRALIVDGDTIQVEHKDGTRAVSHKEPNEALVAALQAEGVTAGQLSTVAIDVVQPTPWYAIGLPIAAGAALLVIAVVRFMRGATTSSGPDQSFPFLKSRARIILMDRPRTRFADAAGIDEAKLELKEVVDFLRAPQRFAAVGARVPRGVLLVGPPGTGKTLLARAVAGEAAVPFFSISASEFVEMFVGVGASRVRDLFGQAKRNAPCIVFIDEIDAVGRHRGRGITGGDDEREQTLNQILVEMDGFDQSTNVVVIAATNRADILDPALLRPGRFDRRITVDSPDLEGRRAILQIHARNKALAPDVDLGHVAGATTGFTGADLENLLNEAAILAAREDRRAITERDLDDAIDRVIAGPVRRSRRIGLREKTITAYHEAGHAVVGHALPSIDPVRKVTIVPRGVAGGFTRLRADADRRLWARSELLELLEFILGGMAAEALVFGETTTGPSNDLEKATGLAHQMVTEFGMSDRLGPAVTGRSDLPAARTCVGDDTTSEIDREVRELVNQALLRARRLLEDRRDTLDLIAARLLVEETLQGDRLLRLLDGDLRDGSPDAAVGSPTASS